MTSNSNPPASAAEPTAPPSPTLSQAAALGSVFGRSAHTLCLGVARTGKRTCARAALAARTASAGPGSVLVLAPTMSLAQEFGCEAQTLCEALDLGLFHTEPDAFARSLLVQHQVLDRGAPVPRSDKIDGALRWRKYKMTESAMRRLSRVSLLVLVHTEGFSRQHMDILDFAMRIAKGECAGRWRCDPFGGGEGGCTVLALADFAGMSLHSDRPEQSGYAFESPAFTAAFRRGSVVRFSPPPRNGLAGEYDRLVQRVAAGERTPADLTWLWKNCTRVSASVPSVSPDTMTLCRSRAQVAAHNKQCIAALCSKADDVITTPACWSYFDRDPRGGPSSHVVTRQAEAQLDARHESDLPAVVPVRWFPGMRVRLTERLVSPADAAVRVGAKTLGTIVRWHHRPKCIRVRKRATESSEVFSHLVGTGTEGLSVDADREAELFWRYPDLVVQFDTGVETVVSARWVQPPRCLMSETRDARFVAYPLEPAYAATIQSLCHLPAVPFRRVRPVWYDGSRLGFGELYSVLASVASPECLELECPVPPHALAMPPPAVLAFQRDRAGDCMSREEMTTAARLAPANAAAALVQDLAEWPAPAAS